jgi:hypothetical protein
MVLLFLPAYLLDLYKQGSIFGRLDLGQWSIVNYFRSSFMSPDGFHSYLLPNICFVFSDLIHPGIIFSGLFFLILIRKKHVDTLFMRSVILVILVYAFFLAGLTFQNDRVLILTFPLVLILFSGPYLTLSEKITKMIHPLLVSEYPKCSVVFSRRGSQINRRITQKIDNVCFNFAKLCVKLCETLRETFIFHSIGQHLKKLAIISLILIQVALFSRAFSPFYRNYRTTRTIAEKMLKYPGKKIYTFNIDMALKGYGVKNETVSLWSSKLDFFEPNALVLFNFTGTRKQWQGMNPMLNWENLNRDHHLKVLEKFPDGWNLYEID